MKNQALKKAAALIIAVSLLAFVGYQVFRNTYSGIRTERAVYGTLRDSIEVSAVIIREEEYVTSDTDGVVRYEVNSGAHIANGGVVASVYSSKEDVQKALELQKIEEQIEELEKLNGFISGSGLTPDDCDKNIQEVFFELLDFVGRKNVLSMDETAKDFLFSLNQKDIISGKVENYNEKIAQLQAECDAIRASFGGRIGAVASPRAGYFIGNADGYETTYSYDDVLSLTVEDLKVTPQKAEVPSNVIGKICGNYKWYVAFIADKEQVIELKQIQDYYASVYLTLPFASLGQIPAEIVAINQESFDSDAAVILQCEYMDETITDLRFEEIQVELYSYSGIMVSQNNIHFADVEETQVDDDGNETVVVHKNVEGVYVVDGSTIEFIQIFPKATVNGYVVCKTSLSDSDILVTGRTIDLYDSIVVGGKDLYDGKLIE